MDVYEFRATIGQASVDFGKAQHGQAEFEQMTPHELHLIASHNQDVEQVRMAYLTAFGYAKLCKSMDDDE